MGTLSSVLKSFSIPYRIELAVTHRSGNHRTLRRQTFSIPYRIELAVTPVPVNDATPGTIFQYPLSDRTRCNHMLDDDAVTLLKTFSIPYRIELAVTCS